MLLKDYKEQKNRIKEGIKELMNQGLLSNELKTEGTMKKINKQTRANGLVSFTNVVFKSGDKMKTLSRSDFFAFAENCLNDYREDKEPALERIWIMAVLSKSGWEFMEALGSVCVNAKRWRIIKDAVQSYDVERDKLYCVPSDGEWNNIRAAINGK